MWWVLTDQQTVPDYTSFEVTAATNVPDHLYLSWSFTRPARRPIYRTFRGVTRICGYTWVWADPTIVSQSEPGNTLEHTFSVDDLPLDSAVYFFLWAPDGPYGLNIQGPLSYVVLLELPPPPEPTPAPLSWDLTNRFVRCGNRYTFWAQESWWVFLPTSDGLTVWQLHKGAFRRRDQAHEPTPPTGTVTDADARLSSDQERIHISYFNRSGWPAVFEVYYATFDIATQTWAAQEQICTTVRFDPLFNETSISLDAANVPHVVYSDTDDYWPGFFYRNRVGGVWSARELALEHAGEAMRSSSAWHDPSDNSFHVLAQRNANWNYHNRRNVGGFWNGITWLNSQGFMGAHHTICADAGEIAAAQIALNSRVYFYEGTFPFDETPILTAPLSKYANCILRPNPPNFIQIVFRNNAGHLAQVWRTPGGVWQPEAEVDSIAVDILTAHYAHPDVIGALWQDAGPDQIFFHAFACAWAGG